MPYAATTSRCGKNWAKQIVDLKLATTLSSSGLGAELVYELAKKVMRCCSC
jgi:hypothetical protein